MRFCSGTICFFNVIYDKRKVKHTNMHIEILNISDWYSWKFVHINLMYKLKGIFVKGGGGGGDQIIHAPATSNAIIRVDSETKNLTSDMAFVPV